MSTNAIPEPAVLDAVAESSESNRNDTPAIRKALMKYRPVNVLPVDWNRVEDFCRRAVLTYGPVNAKVAAEMLSTVTLFVLWATREEHAPLDYASIFHPALMGRYLRSRVSNKKSSAYKSLHSRLFRVANAVADVEHNREKRGRYVVPVHEYTAAELADLESWAGAHRTAERRRHARMVLALMGGAGLWTAETLAVRQADILADFNGYSVSVGGRNARVVPVLSDFASYLDTQGSSSDGSRFVLFPDGANAESRAGSLKLLYRGPHPAPNPQWLRDTWMLRQLRALPVSVVMHAAGMPDVSTLRRYLPDSSLPYEAWESALRNPAAYTSGMGSTGDDISSYGDGTWRAAYGKLRDDVAAATVHMQGESRDSAVNAASEVTTVSAYGSRAWKAATVQLRDHIEPVNTKLGDERTLTTDSTALAAGTPAGAVERAAASDPHDDADHERVDEEKHAPRRIETLEAERTPKRPRKKSRYEALPPSPDDLSTAEAEGQTDASEAKFEAFRAALIAEARRSARGGKR